MDPALRDDRWLLARLSNPEQRLGGRDARDASWTAVGPPAQSELAPILNQQVLATEAWTIENGMLTLSNKLARLRLQRRYADEVEAAVAAAAKQVTQLQEQCGDTHRRLEKARLAGQELSESKKELGLHKANLEAQLKSKDSDVSKLREQLRAAASARSEV